MKTIRVESGRFAASFQDALQSPDVSGAYLMAQCTSCFLLKKIREGKIETGTTCADPAKLCEELSEKGLDIRIFNEKSEIRWIRAGIGDSFFLCRKIGPEEQPFAEEDCWDEDQYLDIDAGRSCEKEGMAVTAGGGQYDLPIPDYDGAKLRIRNYFGYEPDTGQAYIRDWRIVGFVEKGGKLIG